MEKPSFKLETFEGPLDLLLHLIQKNKVSIYDIPIAVICDQYMEYLSLMEDFNMDISSEFLVLASQLLYIKSKMLLPSPADEEEEEDPRDDLVKQLLEYQKYKETLPFLREHEFADINVYYKRPEPLGKNVLKAPLPDLPVSDLVEAFKTILEKVELKTTSPKEKFKGIVGHEKVSVRKMASKIINRIGSLKKIDIYELFSELESRPQVVASFLALLELIKLRRLNAKKSGNTMIIYSLKQEGDTDEFFSEIQDM